MEGSVATVALFVDNRPGGGARHQGGDHLIIVVLSRSSVQYRAVISISRLSLPWQPSAERCSQDITNLTHLQNILIIPRYYVTQSLSYNFILEMFVMSWPVASVGVRGGQQVWVFLHHLIYSRVLQYRT